LKKQRLIILNVIFRWDSKRTIESDNQRPTVFSCSSLVERERERERERENSQLAEKLREIANAAHRSLGIRTDKSVRNISAICYALSFGAVISNRRGGEIGVRAANQELDAVRDRLRCGSSVKERREATGYKDGKN